MQIASPPLLNTSKSNVKLVSTLITRLNITRILKNHIISHRVQDFNHKNYFEQN